jgi:hypothetical protein
MILAAILIFLSLNTHAVFFYDHNIHMGEIPLDSERLSLIQENWVVRQHQLIGNYPNMSEIIQLAKNAATLLNSPPRIYATSGNSVNSWPNQPGATEISYGTRGVQPPPGVASFSSGSAMTLNTLLEPIGSENYQVTFQSTWMEGEVSRSHAWKFQIGADRQTHLIGEEGDPLPQLRM